MALDPVTTKKETMSKFSDLVDKLIKADEAPIKGEVNVAKCQAEAEIVGYLIGRKLRKNDSKFAPTEIDKYHTLALRSLNRVASQAAKSLMGEHKPRLKHELERE